MINYINKAKFNSDSVDKQLTLTFSGGDVITNEDIDAESMKLIESINSGSELIFGSCEASEFEITIRNVYSSHVGQTVTVSMVLDGDTENPFTFGTYKVVEDKATADRLKREIHAYDSMYDILNTDVSAWYNSLYPTSSTTKTVKQIRDSLFTHFGITQEVVTLPNDNVVVGKTISPTSLSGKDVLMALCEINARFGHIGRDGSFKYIRLQEMIQGLYPRNDLYPDDTLYPADEIGTEDVGVQGNYISAKYEEYTVDRIDKLVIRQEDTDIGCVVGSGANAYIIQGNFLVYGKSATDLTTIANAIKDDIFGVWYRPCEVEVRGNPCLEVGDGIRLNTSYEIVYSYIFKRTLSGIQFLRDDFYADGLKQRNEQVNSVQTQIKQLVGKTASIEADVDEVSATLTEQLDDTVVGSYAYQTAQEIGAKVSATDGNTQSFGWTLNSSQWTVYASNYPIMLVNSSGMILNGTIGALGFLTQSGTDKTRIKNGSVMTNAVYLYPSGSTWSDEGDSQGYIASNDMLLGSFNDAYLRFFKNGTAYTITSNGSVRAADFDVGNADYADTAGSAGQASYANIAGMIDSVNVHPSLTAAGNVDLYGSTNAATPTWCANTFEPLSSSDRRLKENIAEVTGNDIKILEKLKVYFFTYKGKESDKLLHCGVMAQDVLAVMEELGIDIDKQSIVEEYETRSYMDEHEICGEKAYRVSYKELSNLLIFAWQKDHERLNSLEDRLNRLEMKNNE